MEGRVKSRPVKPRRQAWVPFYVVALMLLAPFLGGSTRPWSEGIVLAFTGLVIALRPPRSFGSRVMCVILAGLVAMAAIGFLPAGWFGLPAWRLDLERGAGIRLPVTLSPQPWITLDGLILLFAGTVWIGWLQARTWHVEDQRLTFRLFSAGIALFAGFTLAAYFLHWNIPFWLATEKKFGPFPNRNQTANFLAMGSILTLAVTYDSAMARRWITFAWSLALAILGAALVVNYSRGGIVVFFAGVAVWIAILISLSPSIKWISIGTSILLLLVSAFLFFGGETLGRFQGEEHLIGFRSLIFKDTFRMICASSWCGIGLGNFEGIFALFRSVSASESRVIHPESDWLWLWSEMGWPAVLLSAAGIIFLAKQVFPLVRGTNRWLRAAALAAVIAAVLHGFVDVSGHRLGSMLPALFIFGLALPPAKPWQEDRMAPVVFRLLGLLVSTAGVVWFWSSMNAFPLPGTIAAEISKQKTKKFAEENAFTEVIPSATAALGWKPLDWQLYFARGSARFFAGQLPAAAEDFRRARTLETSSVSTPWEESRFWISCRPDLAVIAWQEALKRSQPDEAVWRYTLMIEVAEKQPELLSQLHKLASGNARLEAVWLGQAPAEEFEKDLSNILQLDPDLRSFPAREQSRFFAVWAARGDAVDFIRRLEQHSNWQRTGWRIAADYYDGIHNFEAACKLALRFITPPALPKLKAEANPRNMQKRFYLNLNDFSAGYVLYESQMEAGNEVEAIGTLEQIVLNPDCPPYFQYLLAKQYAKRMEWEKSWRAFAAFDRLKPQTGIPPK